MIVNSSDSMYDVLIDYEMGLSGEPSGSLKRRNRAFLKEKDFRRSRSTPDGTP